MTNCFLFFVHAADRIYTIDISGLNEEETAAVLALQGLANRTVPQIWVEPGKNGGFHGGGYQVQDVNVQRDGLVAISRATSDKYGTLEDVWKEYYASTRQYTFDRLGFEQLFAAFPDLYKGVVKYSGINANAGIAVAVTACGVLDGIPVTESLLNKYTFLKNAAVLDDLTLLNAKNKKEIHRQMIDKYLSLTSKDYAFSFWNNERNYYTIDYAVANRLFSFSLSFADRQIHTDGTKTYPYDNEEAGLLDEIFAYLNPGSILLGWGEPNEYILQARCGEGGHALICTNVSPNLSFHAAIPSTGAVLKQKRQLNEENVIPENKIYITFSINEGDTYKSIGNLMMDGVWLHDKRGEIPFNWPVNPKILHMLPGLAEYYYDTMTDKDYFMAPTSGIGYFDATYSTPEARVVYAEKGKSVSEYADIHYMDVWWNNFTDVDKWVKSMGMKGYTTWTSAERVDYSKAVPRIESELYYDLYNPPTKRKASDMAKYIEQQTISVTNRPWFVHVYACDPTFAAEVMRNLSPDRFEAVCMDEFFALAVKSKARVSGRKIDINKTLMQQLIDATETERFTEEFSALSKWTAEAADYEIKNGEMIITPNGSNYYSLVIKYDNKFNLDKYPFLAARITRFPPNNVKWLLKLYDGTKDIVLRGTDLYQITSFPDVYAWNVKEIAGRAGIMNANLQLVLEASSATGLQGFQMKYDWIRAYEGMDDLLRDLNQSGQGILHPENNAGFGYAVNGNILTVISPSIPVDCIEIYHLTGRSVVSSESTTGIDIGSLPRGVYLLRINKNQIIKVLL
jgi:hypothetical protein